MFCCNRAVRAHQDCVLSVLSAPWPLSARAPNPTSPPATAQASRHGVYPHSCGCPLVVPFGEMVQRMDAAVQLLRPRGPWTRGRSTGQGEVLSSQQKLPQGARLVQETPP